MPRSKNSKRIKKTLRDVISPCANEDELHAWIVQRLGLRIPRRPVCDGHCAPWEYLRRAYFEPAGDQIVWAPRGGGKTRLGAVATLLDLLHKPGIQVRILGGSLEQSLKMWEYLTPDLQDLASDLLDREPRGRNIILRNRSRAAVLAQSQRAVRGMRIHKLRCDEVELFEPSIWQAAQLTVKSQRLSTGPSNRRSDPDGPEVRGVIEAMSTHHKPWGLMSKLIQGAAETGVPIVKWCLLDVLEKCPPERDCNTCKLLDECHGVAKTRCDGFIRIDDAIAMKRRVSKEVWETEMLCRRPVAAGRVFPSFAREIHVTDTPPGGTLTPGELSWAIDFGFAAPFVCLWIMTAPDGRVHVVDEYVKPRRIVAAHVVEMELRENRWGRARWVGCDPAGSALNEQTAESNLQILRKKGYPVRTRRSFISDGIELIRAALQPADGPPTLFVSPRCLKLIKAMELYHYPEKQRGENPNKDGEHDHLIDALRYFYVNQNRGAVYGGRGY